MKKIKAVIFDFDGLMVDTEIVSFRIYEDLLKEYGFSYTIKEYSDDYSGHTEVQNIRRLIETYKLDITDNECYNIIVAKEREYLSKGIDLKKGLRELLNYLRTNGYKTAIATSSTRERCVGILKKHGIESCFDAFVFADDITHSKPDPEVYCKALEKLGICAEDALVIEDAASGILAASAAGIKTVCVPDMKTPEEEILSRTLCVCTSLDEVIDVLENLKA